MCSKLPNNNHPHGALQIGNYVQHNFAMVQALNTKALLSLASVVRRPGLLVPHVSVPTLSQLDYTALRHHAGIEAILFDKDHTLTLPYISDQIHPHAISGLKHCLSVFGPNRVAILSNSVGTVGEDDVNFGQAQRVEVALGVSVIRHKEKKPGGMVDVLQHFHGLIRDNDPARICMVGDRILTDVVFANLYGMLSVHTQPLPTTPTTSSYDTWVVSQDNWTSRLIRPVENRFVYGNWFGARVLQRNSLPHKYWVGPQVSSLILPSAEWNE